MLQVAWKFGKIHADLTKNAYQKVHFLTHIASLSLKKAVFWLTNNFVVNDKSRGKVEGITF